jgi:hypothetical protein
MSTPAAEARSPTPVPTEQASPSPTPAPSRPIERRVANVEAAAGGGSPDPSWAGAWSDRASDAMGIFTEYSIAVASDRVTVARATIFRLGDAGRAPEGLRVDNQGWRDGSLRWSEYVPSTQVSTSYRCTLSASDHILCATRSADGNAHSVWLSRR